MKIHQKNWIGNDYGVFLILVGPYICSIRNFASRVGVNQPCWRNQVVNSFMSIGSVGRRVDEPMILVAFSYGKRAFLILLAHMTPGPQTVIPANANSRAFNAALVLTVVGG